MIITDVFEMQVRIFIHELFFTEPIGNVKKKTKFASIIKGIL